MSFKYVIIGISIGVLAVGIYGWQHRKKPSPAVESTASSSGAIRYLPLGDSYTIGESVTEEERWPNQLVIRLAETGTKLEIVANPSVTGYTTQNLIDRELPLLDSLKPEFVSILIGVNDYVQKVDARTFKKNLEFIVDKVQTKIPNKQNVLLVTIPDYGMTPSGANYGEPAESSKGIENFNSIIKDVGSSRQIPVADIFSVSQAVKNDPSLVAPDGLHPSGKQYTDWTNIILKTIQDNNLPLAN